MKNFNEDPRQDADLDLFREIEEAILDSDTDLLRHQLNSIIEEQKASFAKLSAAFDLADEIDMESIIGENELPEDIADYFESLPKIHIENHHRASTEVVHQIYKEQLTPASELDDADDNDIDFEMWQEMESAILEKDIMDLRASLRQISKASHNHTYSMEDLENYIEGNMSAAALEHFEEDLAYNPTLSRDIDLLIDLDEALSESDVIEMRDILGEVMSRESSLTHSLDEIESFIYDELDQNSKEKFVLELNENDDLRSELLLMKELDQALAEADVMGLRQELKELSLNVMTREEKSILPISKTFHGLKRFGAAAAVIVGLITLSIVIRYSTLQNDISYSLLDESPAAMSAFRSATHDMNINSDLSEGFALYNDGDYHSALASFLKVIEVNQDEPSARFFAGASYQNLEQHRKAILEYEAVIRQGDNLFIEQAEWFSAVCLIHLNEDERALQHLNAIVSRNGFYENKAKILLKKLSR